MVHDIRFLAIGNVLLALGIFGYVTNNIYLAVICLVLAVIFFARQFVDMYLANRNNSEKNTPNGNTNYSPMQSASVEDNDITV
jgi:hypothetical protein